MNTNDGLKIEPAASIIARDMITKYMENFALTIHKHPHVSQSVASVYVDGLAGVMALAIAGGHGSREEVASNTILKLGEALTRDLRELKLTGL